MCIVRFRAIDRVKRYDHDVMYTKFVRHQVLLFNEGKVNARTAIPPPTDKTLAGWRARLELYYGT